MSTTSTTERPFLIAFTSADPEYHFLISKNPTFKTRKEAVKALAFYGEQYGAKGYVWELNRELRKDDGYWGK